MSKLISISIKQDDFNLPTPEVLQEQNIAIYDLEQTNFFQLVGFEAYNEIKLNISLSGNSLVFKISSKKDKTLKTFFLSLTPLKQIINDYYTICESYFNAVKSLPIDKIESIDMGRKGIHNEGARVIIERLENRVKTDLETSRRIFTLVYALTYER
ncbi:UPF0262 family protein [Paracoccaceae bacterium]|nr:UPF0262 family protein [Paracoccaceae bacterium]|tara:strand:- start:81 stop:548 length:468 start_codon:yes stop_codon:yes gene_type:complete